LLGVKRIYIIAHTLARMIYFMIAYSKLDAVFSNQFLVELTIIWLMKWVEFAIKKKKSEHPW
jgi:hypothetical protein